ncbi:MAG: DUF6599 family protein [Pseudomonadota bacterium]
MIVAVLVWAKKTPQPVFVPGKSREAVVQAGLLPVSLGSGFNLVGQIAQYEKETLHERIDGAAPVYIRAGFVELTAAEYKFPGREELVSVDVYDMGSPAQASQMCDSERDPSYSSVEVGKGGYLASGTLNFWHGRYYVKMNGYGGGGSDKELVDLGLNLVEVLSKAEKRRQEAL